MKVLGLSSDFHDSSAAMVVDGSLVASAAEERFTRNKHDSSFPRFATEFCLSAAGIQAKDLDLVVFYEKPFQKWIRVLDSSLAAWPRSRSEFVESQGEWLGKKLWTKALLAKRLGVAANKIIEVEHHHSHLVQAFVGSGFSSAAILTVDAVGENSTAAMARASWKGDHLVVEELGRAVFPHSLGLFYSAITAFLGFKPMNDECSVMALAAFGKPIFAEDFRRMIRLEENGFWQLDTNYLRFDRFLSAPWTEKFTDLVGQPRNGEEKLSFSSLRESHPSPEERHWANIAASAQLVLEEALLHSVSALQARTGEQNLCLAGGVAMNCVANTLILKESGMKLHIPVEPGDGGASIGAAFAGYYSHATNPARAHAYSIYQGGTGNDIEPMLAQIDVEHSWEYQKMGARKDQRHWKWERTPKAASLAADALAEGKVVGLFQGRFELGPRALGNRSILFRADQVEVAERVSREIKDRAPYRPYAISMMAEEAPELLELPEASGRALHWMQLALPVRDPAGLRAGVHTDGTTRPQLVAKKENPFFHELLTQLKARTGKGAVVNTSMNESGYPLVGSAEEALLLFARTSLDLLVLDDLVIRKV